MKDKSSRLFKMMLFLIFSGKVQTDLNRYYFLTKKENANSF